jgi:hypothetical protein
MYNYLTALAFMLICSGCKDQSAVVMPTDSVKLPTLSIRAGSDEKSILVATVSNPSSSDLTIPGFDGDLIYGSYWYQGDNVINVPECGTGFWESVIKIPAGQTRELRLRVPRTAPRGERLTVAVVYGGLGSSTDKEDRGSLSSEEWIRHPDVSLNCRKMESEVSLPEK